MAKSLDQYYDRMAALREMAEDEPLSIEEYASLYGLTLEEAEAELQTYWNLSKPAWGDEGERQ